MADTILNLFLKSRALLDELTDDGVLILDSEVADMQSKYILHIDTGHKELYEMAKLEAAPDEPVTITLISHTTAVNYKADQALTYYGASLLAHFENKELVAPFRDKFESLMRKCGNKAVEVAITDVYAPTEEEEV